MNTYRSEKEWREILGADFGENEVIDARMEEAYQKLRKEGRKAAKRKRRIWKRVTIGLGSVAAAFVLMVMFCAMNPVLAREIPILGGVFGRVADIFSFGRLPEEDTMVFPVGEDETAEEDGSADRSGEGNPYSKEDGGVRVTLTEEYASNQGVFIGIQVENEKGFPEMALFQDGTQHLQARTVEGYSFRTDEIVSLRSIEGKFEDEHTFVGIMRIDYSDINTDDSRYAKMCEEAEAGGAPMPTLTDENYLEYIDVIEVPSSFGMSLEITQLIGSLADPVYPEETVSKEELEQMTDEEWEAYMKSIPQEIDRFPNDYENWYQEGSWKYEIDVTQKDSAARVIEINETNGDGIGIENIELSSVEMTLNTIETVDTFAVALDADGNKLESADGNAYVLAITGHDISKVYLYICDYMEYMDELKGYAYPAEGEKKDKSFQDVLEERALFKTVVEIPASLPE